MTGLQLHCWVTRNIFRKILTKIFMFTYQHRYMCKSIEIDLE